MKTWVNPKRIVVHFQCTKAVKLILYGILYTITYFSFHSKIVIYRTEKLN